MRNGLNPRQEIASATTLDITDITSEASGMLGFDAHEQVWLGRDTERGLEAIVAVHTTVLGPALAEPASGRMSASRPASPMHCAFRAA